MSHNYALDERYERFIDELVKSGRYNSAGEVIEDGLRLLEQRRVREEKLATLRRDIEDGLSSGPAFPLDMDELIEQARHEWSSLKRDGNGA